MDTCRRISTILSAERDRPLRWPERLLAGIHLVYCKPCRRFKAQLRLLQRAARSLGEADPAPSGGLSGDAADRIRAALRAETGEQ